MNIAKQGSSSRNLNQTMAPVVKEKALDPLKDLLGDVLHRLEVLEAKAGVTPAAPAAARTPPRSTPSSSSLVHHAGGEVASVKGYDAYMKSAVLPFGAVCEDLKLQELGSLVVSAWESIRMIVLLASRSKAPSEDLGTALQPHLKETQESIQKLRGLRLDRDLDRHHKAILEMLSCLSWVMTKPPQQLPHVLVKESLSSVEFWTNRIRKDFKNKDEKQIAFCDATKKVILELVSYIQEFHKTGLTFSPRGVSLAEASIRLSDEPNQDVLKSPGGNKRHPTLSNVVAGGNMAGIMGELTKRKTADGSSAATGLKHVSKDQQTWRKEFKKDEKPMPAVPSLDASAQPAPKKKEKKKPRGLPIFEYQDRGFKWVIENHSKETTEGVMEVEISDPKQQVYVYNCEGVTVKVNGKFKSLVLDNCEKCAVVYDTLISSAEVVNCKKIQLQVTGVCPVFTIDKTTNIVVYLSEESKSISTFTTSLSSEMNVSFPDGDDQKEVPIPEQFVHKISGAGVSSDVSDLYH